MRNFQCEVNEDQDLSRWDLWVKHREGVNGLFEEIHNKKGKVNRIGIIGAGNCDDLDLEYISKNCNEIYLFDIDLNSMKQAIRRYPFEIQNKLRLIKVDITTLDTSSFYQEYLNLLSSKAKPKSIIDFLVKSANNLNIDNMKEFYNTCDIVASSAIYTQLVYNWAYIKLYNHDNYYTEKELNTINERGLGYFLKKLIVFYNKIVVRFCTSTAAIIAWADMFEIYPNDYKQLLERGFEEIKDIISVRGYSASRIGVADLENKLDSHLNRTWAWQFDESKTYLCMGISGFLKEIE